MSKLPKLDTEEAIDAWAMRYARAPRGADFTEHQAVMQWLAECVRLRQTFDRRADMARLGPDAEGNVKYCLLRDLGDAMEGGK